MSRARSVGVPVAAVWLALALYPSTALHARRRALARRARLPVTLIATLLVAVLSLSTAAAVTTPRATMWVSVDPMVAGSAASTARSSLQDSIDRVMPMNGDPSAGGQDPDLAGVSQVGGLAGLRNSGSVAVSVTVRRAAAPGVPSIPIFRFYSAKSGTHFYTPSAAERDQVIARWPDIWKYEGVAYWVNPAKNTQPLYRFYNWRIGSHFYTASKAERDMVIARYSGTFSYDGPTYAVTPSPAAGKATVYRFLNVQNGSHFYTANAAERDTVLARWPHIYRLEGPAFWIGQ